MDYVPGLKFSILGYNCVIRDSAIHTHHAPGCVREILAHLGPVISFGSGEHPGEHSRQGRDAPYKRQHIATTARPVGRSLTGHGIVVCSLACGAL